ncbi:MAG: class I SAM-dependent methyltransferase [Congregibacter sp.]|nr:class I SAM-dependent methyltransferase [Congregibacter sp.]
MDLPFSQAAENNCGPIVAELQRLLVDARTVLEIGSGTGQHAVAFAAAMPALRWQPSEHPDSLGYLQPRCAQSRLKNLAAPIPLDICQSVWPPWPDAVYTANTLHIVAKEVVQALFSVCGSQGTTGSQLIVYGPFNYGGQYTSESNANFDLWLKDRNPQSAIRDFEWVDSLAAAAGYVLSEDIAMPANNRLLVWRRGIAV